MNETMQLPLLASISRKRIFSVLFYTESAWFVITGSLDGRLMKLFLMSQATKSKYLIFY